MHVGHGRGAVFGSVLSSLLQKAGFEVDEEYYVNDFGRQMNILSASLYIRYAQTFNEEIKMIKNGYQGDYLISIAKNLKNNKSDSLYINDYAINSLLLNQSDEDEKFTDQVINAIKTGLGDEFLYVKNFALKEILEIIKKDLLSFGVKHNQWFSESSLYDEKLDTSSMVDKSINELETEGFVYEKEDALWFKSSEFEDDKDRVEERKWRIYIFCL